jgi:hypothetical protein
MGSIIAIGLVVLFFVLSLFSKKLMRGRILPVVYLACTIYFIVAAISGDVRLYIAIIFILLGIYGIIRCIQEPRSAQKQTSH